MYKQEVRGQMEVVALFDGSYGRFLGDVEGLYEAYREGYERQTPDGTVRVGNPREQHATVELANGTLALTVRHDISFTRQRTVNPYSIGKDPFVEPPSGSAFEALQAKGVIPAGVKMPMVSVAEASRHAGGPPSGGPPGGGPPGGGPPGGGPPGGGPPTVNKLRSVWVAVDGDKSTGIYEGASGEMELTTPNHREFGNMTVQTANGELALTFTEHVDAGKLYADLQVNGDRSTGIYKNARGNLSFELDLYIASLAKGSYWGTIELEHAPSAAG